VITLKLISNISESYDAMASKVDVLHRKMYNRQPQVIGKTFENLEIPGKPKELLVYGSNAKSVIIVCYTWIETIDTLNDVQ